MSISRYIDLCMKILKIQFVLEGFVISIWQILLFFIIAGILVLLIGGILK